MHGPAGSGKTSLVASWVVDAWRRPVSWYTLDERDRIGPEFWTNLVAAIDRLRPGSLDALDRSLRDAFASGVRSPTNSSSRSIAATGEPATLVLDDFQVIADSPN